MFESAAHIFIINWFLIQVLICGSYEVHSTHKFTKYIYIYTINIFEFICAADVDMSCVYVCVTRGLTLFFLFFLGWWRPPYEEIWKKEKIEAWTYILTLVGIIFFFVIVYATRGNSRWATKTTKNIFMFLLSKYL